MKWLNRVISILLLPILAVSLISVMGCEKKVEEGYDIYYKNSEGTKLVAVKYQTETTDPETLADEFIAKMRNVDEGKNYVGLIPSEVLIEKVDMRGATANVYFNNEYNNMRGDAEVLLRAGVVKTLTQLKNVVYVQFYVDGVVAQYSDGSLMGMLEADDFVDDSAVGMDSIEWKEIDLYYCNELGDKLVKQREKIAYNKNVSLEKMVVEKLIKGPSNKQMQATLPTSIKVLNISVNDRICYVNLDSSFLTEMVNVSAEIPVYSIVNTLCSLSGIDSVRILINGDTAQAYREMVRLDANMTFNYDLIESSTTNKNHVK